MAHGAAATKATRHKRGGGAATTREQRTARRETQTRQERTESRERGSPKNKQHTAPRPRAPGARNQRKPETTGAQNAGEGKKSTERQRRKSRDTKGEGRGGAATTREQPTARRETPKRREHTESREARSQQNKHHTAPRPRAPGAENQRKPGTTGAQIKDQKKTRHGAAATRTARHKRGGGGVGSNHQGAANGQAGDTEAARAHREPRSGRPTKKHHTPPRPRAPGAGNQRKQRTKRARRKQQREKEKKRGGGKQRSKKGETPARRGQSTAEGQSGQRNR